MYKTSKYNYFIDYEDKVIWFNGFSGAMLAPNQKKSIILESLLGNLSFFEITHPALFKKLKDAKFIVEEDLDEVNLIKHLNRERVYDRSHAQITINPTRNCNFSCWYCVQPHKQSMMSEDTQNKIKLHIANLVSQKEIKNLELSWFGGEPLLGFHEVIYPMSKYCKNLFEENDLQLTQQITTNGYLIDEAMVEKMQEINLNNFQITLDGDEKRHNTMRNENGQPSFKTILHNINLICAGIKNPNISLRINYDLKTLNGNITGVLDSIPQEYRKYITIDFQRVWQVRDKKKVESASIQQNNKHIELQKYAKHLGFRLGVISHGLTINNWANCYADKANYKHFDYNGKLYKCTATDYSEKYQFGEISEGGIISWDMNKMSKMYGKSTFDNEMCLQCKNLPLCKGSCSQIVYERAGKDLPDVCYLKQSKEVNVETFIADLYEKAISGIAKNCDSCSSCKN